MTFKPSKYQKKVFDFIKNDNKNCVINAVAGSGKTTTILECLKLIPNEYDVLFMAFNRSIKDEIIKRAKVDDKKVVINTSHGIGYQILLKNFGKVEIKDSKYTMLLRHLLEFNSTNDDKDIINYNFKEKFNDLIRKFNLEFKSFKDKVLFEKNIIKLIGLVRMSMALDNKSVTNLIKKHNIILSEEEQELALPLVILGSEITSVIDYTDMVYMPIHFKLPTNKYDIIFVDECQDLNTAQRELMLSQLKENGRFISVGDKNQAIYGFSGADNDSFDILCNQPNTIVLPLSETYRCGKNIIEKIKYHVKQIVSHKDNIDGEFIDDYSVKDLKPGDTVLCRNTFPLVKLNLFLLKNGKKANIVGSDIITPITKMINDSKEEFIDNCLNKLYLDLSNTINSVIKKMNCSSQTAKKMPEVSSMIEKILIISSIAESIGVNVKSEAVVLKIMEIFNDSENGIILSTIHRVKGLEFDEVFIIQPELLPIRDIDQEWIREQEENLKYVAYTRAKKVLGLIRDFDAFNSDSNVEIDAKIGELLESQSKHIGLVGQKIKLTGEITSIKKLESYNTTVYDIKDTYGNIYEKWGPIGSQYILSTDPAVKVGTKVSGYCVITKHTEFNNMKKNRIKGL